MKVLGIYLLQLIAASAILYGYYHFFLKNKKFHQYNRYYLLAAIIISIFVPFFQIPFYFTQEEANASALLKTLKTIYYSESDDVVIRATTQSHFNWNLVPFIIYGIIATVLLGKIIFSVWKVKKIIKAHPSEELEGVHFVNTAEPGTPFSFFRWLFWNKDIELDSEKGQKIFRHEIFHIQQKHSWDVLFAESISMLLWINPFFHIIKKEIRAIHEFLADEFATKEEDKWEYAELLLMQALQTKQTLVTPFFHNQIKRRIAMITNSQKTSHRYLRKLLALPLTILVVLLLAFTYKNKNIEQQNNAAETNNITITPVNDTTSKDVHEAIELLGAVMDKKPGELVRFKGISDTTEMPLIIVDNVKIKDHDALRKMNADNIQSMSVFKGEKAIERFGKDGENGVINIITKNSGISATSMDGTVEMRKNDISNPNEKIVTGYQIKINPSANSNENLLIQKDQGFIIKGHSTFDTARQPLIVVNGVKMPTGYTLNNINPENIEAVTVLKDKSATSQYGIEGADGAVLITTKDKTPLKINNIPIDTASPNKLNEVVVTGYGIRPNDNNKLFEQVEQPATFPGGDAEWRKFLERQLNANVGIENKAPSGTYYSIVQFVVHTDGSISDIKSLTDNGYGIDQEAIRVISKGPKWKPAIQNGKEVSSIKKQRITFIVNDDDSKPKNPELKEVVVVGYGTKAPSTPPSFKGGQTEWIKYLEKNLNANIPVDKGSPTGTFKTQTQFLVRADGTATEFKSLTKLGYGMEEEALKLIQSVKLWEPAKYNGKNIDAYMIQPITFTIESDDDESDNKKPSVDNLSAIYPNPATSKVQLQFDATIIGKGNVIVTDMNGAVKMTTQVGLSKGKNNVFINVSGLAQGTYIVSLKGAGADKTAVYKMVKQ